MISSEAVLMAAEKVAEDIIEAYKPPTMTFKEWQQLWGPADPWHEFTKACRAERKACSDACSSSRENSIGSIVYGAAAHVCDMLCGRPNTRR